MFNSLKTWLGQVTTGHGVMVLSGTLVAVFSGLLTWAGAVPLVAAGVVGLIWPESAAGPTAAAGLEAAYINKGAVPPSTAHRI